MYWTQMCIRVQALQFFRFLLNGFIMYFGKLCSRRYCESSFFLIRKSGIPLLPQQMFLYFTQYMFYQITGWLTYVPIQYVEVDLFTYPFNIGILFFRHLPIASEKDVQVVNTNVMCRQIRAITAFVNQIQNVQEE